MLVAFLSGNDLKECYAVAESNSQVLPYVVRVIPRGGKAIYSFWSKRGLLSVSRGSSRTILIFVLRRGDAEGENRAEACHGGRAGPLPLAEQ